MPYANPPARPKAEPRERAGAIVVDRNRATAKRLARLLVSAGYTVKTYEDVTTPLLPALQGEPAVSLWLVVGEAAAAEAICGLLSTLASRREPGRRCYAALYGAADELDVPTLLEQPGLVALLGLRPNSGRLDLESELLGLASHLRGQPLLPLQAYLLWGAQAFSTGITNIGGRDAAEARIIKLCTEHLNISRRVADNVGEVVHELITNAMYDAPVDDKGRPRYAHDRTANIELGAEDKVTFRYGTDGIRLCVETADRFGRLRRSDLVRSLKRAAAGQINQGQGGAGIGLSLVYRTSQTLQVDVEPGGRTRVTSVMELDAARTGEGQRPGRSLIFPDLTPMSGRHDL
jgi:hypothetical protein